MKGNNYIKILSAVLILFGSTVGQSQTCMEQAKQEMLTELRSIYDSREKQNINFKQLYDRMERANKYYKPKIVDFTKQSSISQYRAISILSYIYSTTNYILSQYYDLFRANDLNKPMQKLSGDLENIMQDLAAMPNTLLQLFFNTLVYCHNPNTDEIDENETMRQFASRVNYALDDIINLFNKIENILSKNISNTKISKQTREKLKFFAEDIRKITNVFPVFYNVDAINKEAKYSVL